MILTPKILARLVAIVHRRRAPAALLLLPGRPLPRQPRHAAGAGRRPRPARRQPDRRRLPASRSASCSTACWSSRSAAPRWSCSATGYLAGLFRERFEIHSALVPPLLCMGLTLFAELGFGAVAADARDRRPGQPADRPRHAAEERLRLLPRLADLPRRAARAAPGPGRGAARCGARQPADACWEPRDDVPALRRTRPADEQPPRAADRGLRRRRRRPLRVLFFRLWFLQVLDGDKYLAEAKNNRTREFRVSAPRGDILDRNGEVLVDNRPAWRCRSTRRSCPKTRPSERAELARLAELTHMTLPQVRRTIARRAEEVAAGGAGDAAPRRRPRPRLLPAKRTRRAFPGVERAARLRPPLPATAPSPPTSSAASARSPKKS